MTKTILITGATDGIGRLTAQMLAEQGHNVLLHGRSEEKLRKAAADIGSVGGTYSADLSCLRQTSVLADKILSQHTQLDVLINNAGVLKIANPYLPGGMDARFVVNTLAPYILTKRLLPVLGNEGRVLNLSSAAQAPVNLAALTGKERLDDMAAYAQSKLALTIWTAAMARAHPEGPVFIAINPGSLLASKMVVEGFGIEGNDLRIGADILCRAALDEAFSTASGQYYDNDAGGFGQPHRAGIIFSHVNDVMSAIEELAMPWVKP